MSSINFQLDSNKAKGAWWKFAQYTIIITTLKNLFIILLCPQSFSNISIKNSRNFNKDFLFYYKILATHNSNDSIKDPTEDST